jgi:hypothetical protein
MAGRSVSDRRPLPPLDPGDIMPVPVLYPKVSLEMQTGRIARWLVGRRRDRQPPATVIFEIDNDKAAVEVEAPAAGILRHLAAEGRRGGRRRRSRPHHRRGRGGRPRCCSPSRRPSPRPPGRAARAGAARRARAPAQPDPPCPPDRPRKGPGPDRAGRHRAARAGAEIGCAVAPVGHRRRALEHPAGRQPERRPGCAGARRCRSSCCTATAPI